jgi:NitT/TauT family transport system substrate-binding protein
MVRSVMVLLCLVLPGARAYAQDLVRVGNMKFAHYGAIAYTKELAPKFNLKIEERIFAKGVDIMPAIVAGEIDAAASAAEAAIAGRANGVPIYLVAGFARGGARLVTAAGSGITTVEGLKGKRVGVTRGGAQELLLLAELDKHGLTWSERPGKDVRILYLAYADLNQALAGHQIDAMCQSEPQSAQALSRKIGVELTRPSDTATGEPVRAVVVTEKLYRERPAVAERFVALVEAATRAFQKDPALAERYVRESLFRGQLASQDYRDAMSNAAFSTDVTVAQIATTTTLMQKYGVGRMARPPRAEDWVKLDLLERARGHAQDPVR